MPSFTMTADLSPGFKLVKDKRGDSGYLVKHKGKFYEVDLRLFEITRPTDPIAIACNAIGDLSDTPFSSDEGEIGLEMHQLIVKL